MKPSRLLWTHGTRGQVTRCPSPFPLNLCLLTDPPGTALKRHFNKRDKRPAQLVPKKKTIHCYLDVNKSLFGVSCRQALRLTGFSFLYMTQQIFFLLILTVYEGRRRYYTITRKTNATKLNRDLHMPCVLYEYWLAVFENKLLRRVRIFGPRGRK
jgi:hypothetical protein